MDINLYKGPEELALELGEGFTAEVILKMHLE